MPNLRSKRKLAEDDVSNPAAKKPALPDEVEEQPCDFLKLPPEMLLYIFKFLLPEDNCIKALAECCTVFRNIISSRLRVLRLDFDKIFRSNRYPVIERAYSEIKIFGEEIDYNRSAIKGVLKSSEQTARKLVLNVSSRSKKRCKIKIRTLMFILSCLPKLDEIEMLNIDTLMPQISKSKPIKTSEQPRLANLRKLTMKNVTGLSLSSFSKVNSIEEVDLNINLKNKAERKLYDKIVRRQKKLRVFRSITKHGHVRINFKELLTFNANIASVHHFKQLLKNSPKLMHIKTKIGIGTRFQFPLTMLTEEPSMKNLETFEYEGLFLVGNVEVNAILNRLPSLKCFKDRQVTFIIENDKETDKQK